MPVTKSNKTRDRLAYLRDNLCLKWEEIAAMPEFNHPLRIPQRTLYMIYIGKRAVPKKYCRQLGEPETAPAPVCSACGKVHAYDRACEMQVIVKPKPVPRKRKQKARYPRFYAWLWEQF